jgi:hypothetical protein
MITPRQQARLEVSLALRASFPREARGDPPLLEEYGDCLFVLAELHKVPDEVLISWIREKPPGKDFSVQAWRALCDQFSAARLSTPPPPAIDGTAFLK